MHDDDDRTADDDLLDPDLTDAILEIDPKALAELVLRAQRQWRGSSIGRKTWSDLSELRALARQLVAERAGTQRVPDLRRAVNPDRMCQTQVCLSLALHLLQQDMVVSDVTVAISGREVTRGLRPTFNIPRFLQRRGALPASPPRSGSYRYTFPDTRFGIVTEPDTGDGDVVAEIGPGGRLITYATPGPLIDTESSLEHTLLRNAIGNAVTRVDVEPLDLLVVAVPRSPRMRRLVAEMRAAPRVVAAALSLITVAQAGAVDGLPLPRTYVPKDWG